MEDLPNSVLGVTLCESYVVYCNGQCHLVVENAGVPVDNARIVAKHPTDAVVVEGAGDCSREDCHQRDASRVVMERLRRWATNLD